MILDDEEPGRGRRPGHIGVTANPTRLSELAKKRWSNGFHGRRRVPGQTADRRLTVNLNHNELMTVRRLARELELTVSAMVRGMINDYEELLEKGTL